MHEEAVFSTSHSVNPVRAFGSLPVTEVIDLLPQRVAVLDGLGRILQVNESWRRFGDRNGLRMRNGAVGANYLQVCSSATGNSARSAIAALNGIVAVSQGRRSSFEMEYDCRDGSGSRLWFVMQVEPFAERRTIVFHHNVTQRKTSTQELIHTKLMLPELLEVIPVAILVVGSDGCLRRANSLAKLLLGDGLREGRSLTRMLVASGRDHPAERHPTQRALAGERHTATDMVIRTTGGNIPVQIWAAPLFYSGGKVEEVVVSIVDIRDQKRVKEEVRFYQRQLRALASQISLAEERERRRLASGLHDGTIQNLCAVRLRLAALGEAMSETDRGEEVEDLLQLMDDTIESTRSLAFQIGPPVLYELGLADALDWLSDQFESEHGLPCEMKIDALPRQLDKDMEAFLFRTTRELLINVGKHAHASKATVTLSCSRSRLEICVADDGVGFASTVAAPTVPESSGFGLFSIRERIRPWGGELKLTSGQGRGSMVRVLMNLSRKGGTSA